MSRELTIPLSPEKENGEFIKVVGYASEEIISFHLDQNSLVLKVTDEADDSHILANIQKLLLKYVDTDSMEETYHEFEGEGSAFLAPEEVYASGLAEVIEDGLVTLKDEAVLLFDYFDRKFVEIARAAGCEERVYPVLLPTESYEKTGYLKNSPQYAIFCCELDEDIAHLRGLDLSARQHSVKPLLKEPTTALSPSACFHVYDEFESQVLRSSFSLTFQQKVFRNEGRFNWGQYGRLKAYSIRELVFLGTKDYVLAQRTKIMDSIISFLNHIGLGGKIVTASDPFVIPEVQNIKRFQIAEKSKYELRLRYGARQELSCGSFNWHGHTFSERFGFHLSEDATFSGCVGFGLERWVLAFLSQYGTELENWPKEIQEGLA